MAANPSGSVYGLKVANTNEPPKTVQTSSSPLVSVLDSNDCLELPEESSSPPEEIAPIVGENLCSVIETPLKPQSSIHNQTLKFSKKRRQIAKDEERKKLIRLTEEHTEAITRQTAALEKLTAAIGLLKEKF